MKMQTKSSASLLIILFTIHTPTAVPIPPQNAGCLPLIYAMRKFTLPMKYFGGKTVLPSPLNIGHNPSL